MCRRLKTLLAVICRHREGVCPRFHRYAIQFSCFGVKLHAGGELSLQLVCDVHLLVHVAGGDDIRIRHVFDRIGQVCCADHRLDRGAAQMDDHTLLSFCRYDQVSGDLAGAVRYDPDLGQVLKFAVFLRPVCCSKRLQCIVSRAAHCPVVVDLDVGGVFKPY